MFKEKYQQIYDRITPDAELLAATLEVGRPSGKKRKKFAAGFRRPLLAGAFSILACLILAVPVFAAHIPAVYHIVYELSPEMAQFFKPVRKSDEHDGIKMEVVSADIRDNVAEIFITLEDMTGSRIDASCDLFDSYSIRSPFAGAGGCVSAGFDEETRTKSFLVSVTQFGDREIEGDKITFSVGEFLSGKQRYEDVPLDVDWSGLFAFDTSSTNNTNSPETMPLPTEYGGGGGGIGYDFQNSGQYTVLAHTAPAEIRLKDGGVVSGITITGMGYLDGRLHLQIFTGKGFAQDNHGYFFFRDKAGNAAPTGGEYETEGRCLYSLTFNEMQDGEILRYQEEVFVISPEELAEYDLYGYFVTGGRVTEGPWEVTFPLE